ncbi:hypothetical protein SALBM217S_10026 [Streptomyces griseoloalbus]
MPTRPGSGGLPPVGAVRVRLDPSFCPDSGRTAGLVEIERSMLAGRAVHPDQVPVGAVTVRAVKHHMARSCADGLRRQSSGVVVRVRQQQGVIHAEGQQLSCCVPAASEGTARRASPGTVAPGVMAPFAVRPARGGPAELPTGCVVGEGAGPAVHRLRGQASFRIPEQRYGRVRSLGSDQTVVEVVAVRADRTVHVLAHHAPEDIPGHADGLSQCVDSLDNPAGRIVTVRLSAAVEVGFRDEASGGVVLVDPAKSVGTAHSHESQRGVVGELVPDTAGRDPRRQQVEVGVLEPRHLSQGVSVADPVSFGVVRPFLHRPIRGGPAQQLAVRTPVHPRHAAQRIGHPRDATEGVMVVACDTAGRVADPLRPSGVVAPHTGHVPGGVGH